MMEGWERWVLSFGLFPRCGKDCCVVRATRQHSNVARTSYNAIIGRAARQTCISLNRFFPQSLFNVLHQSFLLYFSYHISSVVQFAVLSIYAPETHIYCQKVNNRSFFS